MSVGLFLLLASLTVVFRRWIRRLLVFGLGMAVLFILFSQDGVAREAARAVQPGSPIYVFTVA